MKYLAILACLALTGYAEQAEFSGTAPADENSRIIDIAYAQVEGKLLWIEESKALATVKFKDDLAIVTFPIPEDHIKRPPAAFEGDTPPPYPGPEFIARITMDRHTYEIRETLAGH